MQVQEYGDNLIPFAKEWNNKEGEKASIWCSRVVSRSPSPSLPSQSLVPRVLEMSQRYGDVFWENLSQRPSPTWMEEKYILPTLRATGCSQPGLYPLEGLLPPEVLCRRKRKRPQLERMQQGPGSIPARVRAVTYHLEDIRKRQRTINELKKGQWGSSGAASEPLVLEEEDCGFPSTAGYSELEEDHGLAPDSAQLLWSPWSPLGQEVSCSSRQWSSLAPFSAATARRDPFSRPWGMELESEE